MRKKEGLFKFNIPFIKNTKKLKNFYLFLIFLSFEDNIGHKIGLFVTISKKIF